VKRTTLKRTKRLNPTSHKTAKRNGKWRKICLARAEYLIEKYGFIICEYSGEPIRTLSSTGEDLDDGWGHHIDHNRANVVESNCYIVKYFYHRIIEDENISVKQEGFEGVI